MLRIASWNINSVRLRIDQVARFVQERAPDVLLLQEIKCTTDQFPRAAFEAMGLPDLRAQTTPAMTAAPRQSTTARPGRSSGRSLTRAHAPGRGSVTCSCRSVSA